MLPPKTWRAEAVVRLLLSVVICIFAGSLLVEALQYSGPVKYRPQFYAATIAALAFLLIALILTRKPWRLENVTRLITMLLACFYTGVLLGAWAGKLAGKVEPSTSQMIVSTMSFQGAALVLITLFVREHQISWNDAFGFRNQWLVAVLLGIILACLFLPLGRQLQKASAELLLHLPRLHLMPEDQEAVQVLATAQTWRDRLALGVVTILLVPPAEELLFRGILYTWIKQLGFPRLALWGTAVVFGLVHMNLVSFIPLTVLALALTLLYEHANNLLAPITAHAVFNALNFAWLYWGDWILHQHP